MGYTSMKFDNYYKFEADDSKKNTLVLKCMCKPYKHIERLMKTYKRLRMHDVKSTFLQLIPDGKQMKLKLIKQKTLEAFCVTQLHWDAALVITSDDCKSLEIFIMDGKASLSSIIEANFKSGLLERQLLKMRSEAKRIDE
jgi:hypothetical protein